MPPKKDEAPAPKKPKEVPEERCGCGVNMYRAPPKGKKVQPPPEHEKWCSFQRATCNRYPHLPRCAVCEDICSYCRGINPWCTKCSENKCKFQYKRDVLAPIGMTMPVLKTLCAPPPEEEVAPKRAK